jgi:hypothetical protein
MVAAGENRLGTADDVWSPLASPYASSKTFLDGLVLPKK